MERIGRISQHQKKLHYIIRESAKQTLEIKLYSALKKMILRSMNSGDRKTAKVIKD